MKVKQSAASSRREKLVVRSEADIRNYARSAEAKRIGERLKASGPDPSEADLREVPELSDERLAAMYRPLKQPVSVRLDADILAWLRSKGGKYQTVLNATLRDVMKKDK